MIHALPNIALKHSRGIAEITLMSWSGKDLAVFNVLHIHQPPHIKVGRCPYVQSHQDRLGVGGNGLSMQKGATQAYKAKEREEIVVNGK